MSIFDHYGKDFFENQLPEIIEELHRIGDAVSPREKIVAEAIPEFTEDAHQIIDAVYVCYEENSVELYSDAGNISNMYVTADVDKVKEWANLALNNAKKISIFRLVRKKGQNCLIQSA